MHEAPVDAGLPPARVADEGARTAYWAAVQPQLTSELSLPADRVRTADSALTRSAHGLALPANAPDDVLIAAWVTTLARVSGQYELTVGLPAADPDTLVPVPVVLDPTTSYGVVLGAISALHAEAAAHAPAPMMAEAFRVAVARKRDAEGAHGAELVLVLDADDPAIEHTAIFDAASIADLEDQWRLTVEAATAD
ncbi:MAG: hypothetical protein JWL71_95, partial [Acidobacteria bacterium]|nr:hypothetical protein [Acidobacteriota bacterium]